MIKTTIIYENQRGLLFRNGKLKKILNPGLYRTLKFELLCFRHRGEIEVIDILKPLHSCICDIHLLITKNKLLAKNTRTVIVNKNNLKKVYFNGIACFLPEGRYFVWSECFSEGDNNIIDISQTYISDPQILVGIPKRFFYSEEVKEPSVLYIDGIEQSFKLQPGNHYFWENDTKVRIDKTDKKESSQKDAPKTNPQTLRKIILKICFIKSQDFFKKHDPKQEE